MTQKVSQIHFRIQTRSQRLSEGPRPRRMTKTLQPSSQVLLILFFKPLVCFLKESFGLREMSVKERGERGTKRDQKKFHEIGTNRMTDIEVTGLV